MKTKKKITNHYYFIGGIQKKKLIFSCKVEFLPYFPSLSSTLKTFIIFFLIKKNNKKKQIGEIFENFSLSHKIFLTFIFTIFLFLHEQKNHILATLNCVQFSICLYFVLYNFIHFFILYTKKEKLKSFFFFVK